MLNPYLFYDGNCEAAFRYYEKVLGGKIEFLLRADEGPADMKPSPGNEKLIMHARMSVKGQILMASDAPPGHFHKPQGFAVSLTIPDLAEAEKTFKALAQGGSRDRAVRQDVLLEGIWHVHRSVRRALDGELSAGGDVSQMLVIAGSSPAMTSLGRRYHLHDRYIALSSRPRSSNSRLRQSAAADDPVAHRAGIGLQHQLRSLRLGIDPAAAIDRAGGMEAEHGAARDADALARHDAQHQRAGGQAGAVDHHALAGGAHLVEEIDEGADLPAGAAR